MLKSLLILSFGFLSACGPLVYSDVEPMKFAPVTVLFNQPESGTEQNTLNQPASSTLESKPASTHTANSSFHQTNNSAQIIDISGCWEFKPSDPNLPIQRRYYEPYATNAYYFTFFNLTPSGERLTESYKKGRTNQQNTQKRLLNIVGSSMKVESFHKPDINTLEAQGVYYQKLDDKQCQ